MTVTDTSVSRRPAPLSDRVQRYGARFRASAAEVRRALAVAFPERQILIRECGRMSIYRLSRTTQAAAATVAIVMSGFTVAVVVAIALAEPQARPNEVSAVIAVKLERSPPVTQHAGDRADRTPEAAETSAATMSVEPDAAVAENARTAEKPISTAAAFPAPAAPVKAPSAAGGSDAGSAISLSFKPNTVTAVAVGSQREKAADAPDPLAPLDQNADGERLRAQLAAIDDRVFALATRGLGAPPAAEDARAARLAEAGGLDGVHAHVASIERHVERLANRVSALRSAENALVREVKPQLAYFIETAERVIERAGLDLDDVFRDGDVPKKTSAGGPFVAALSGPLAAERAALQTDLAYWQALRGLVQRMPLAAPLDRYAVSSSFGTRRDPLNNRKAKHNGLDMISAIGAPIRAPAPGTVVFAGRNGGYGNFIEIDHGRSLRTRYAHLRAIKVKKGDKVEFLQRIGTLGNSGRSTGAHLHYEVVVAGKAVDPMNFIKAGQHVFQD